MIKPWLIGCAWVFAGAASAAENCEALRAQIEAKIAAAGVARFTVTTVDAAAPAEGQVVGSCELGSRKIVYQRDRGAGFSPETAAPRRRGEPMLTECKDGSVSVGGDCPR
ncbi:DUF1161 domain-containing protein [Variovorax sp. M-6]|uniref:DUF1161 domain-containing protein n=1 Tax=Variovorax sp. M-6 TaxID=3233041 RepID=UPI003F998398